MQLRLVFGVLVVILVSGVLSDDVKKGRNDTDGEKTKEKRTSKFKEGLKKGRGRRIQETDDELEYVREKLQKRGDRWKKKLALSTEQAQELSKSLKKAGRMDFKTKMGDRMEEVNANEDVEGYLYEGDILLTKEQADMLEKADETEASDGSTRTKRETYGEDGKEEEFLRRKREAFEDDGRIRAKRQAYKPSTYPATLWTSPIPYTLDSSLSAKAKTMIAKGIAFWEANTCISFKENATGLNSLRFFSGVGCYSYIGRIASWSSQEISIGSGCESIRTTTHEIGHALGFFHAQSRVDRDSYVTINLANVQAGKEHNFDKETSATNYNYGQPYDYGSVMHYGPYSFAIDSGIPTIVPKDNEYLSTMGSGREPGFYDVLMMNKLYSCLDKCSSYSTVCYNGGYKNPKNCAICKCPSGYGGNYCTTRPTGCGTSLTATTAYQNYTSANVGAGTYTTLDDFAECNYWITAPAGKRIQVQLLNVGYVCAEGCYYGGVEFKTKADQMLTGFRYCCTEHKGKTFTTDGNTLPIIVFSRYYYSGFTISYRYVDGIATTTPSTTVTTKATTTTTKATTTTTKATTTTKKATTTTAGNDWVYFSVTDSFYLVVPVTTNFTWHENNCVKQGAHLVSIHFEEENRFVQELLKNQAHTFTGLQYVNGVGIYTDGTALDYTNWYPTNADCKATSGCTIKWHDQPYSCGKRNCDNYSWFGVCKKPTYGSTAEWTYFAETDSRYLLVDTKAAFDWQEKNCVSKGGHLVSIHSEAENQFVQNFLANKGHTFTGLQYVNGVGTYTDGTALDYTNWYPTNADCSATTGCAIKWYDEQYSCGKRSCTNYIWIGVCKKPMYDTSSSWIYFGETRAYYLLVETGMTFAAHESNCVAKGGHLVSIHSAEENEIVTTLLAGRGHTYTGLQYTNGVGKYTDGTPLDYTNWYPSNADCKATSGCTIKYQDNLYSCSKRGCSYLWMGVCKRTTRP